MGEKEKSSNQFTIVVISSEVEEDIKVREVDMIPEVGEELRKVEMIPEVGEELEDGSDNREEEVGVELDPDEEDIKDVVLNDDRESHSRMVFKDKNGRV